MREPILEFQGEYRWLSNFHPVEIFHLGETFPSVEHAYQASKCLREDDIPLFRSGTAGQMKRLGRKIQIRPDWLQVRIPVMRELLLQKFGEPELKERLLATGNRELIEGNTWHDQFWGSCFCAKHVRIFGENQLGRLLMEVREIKRFEPPFK